MADRGGFAGTVVSDRFQPWLPTQGEASFGWAVLSALGQVTDGDLTISAVPGYRMHPASVAQASATLSAMYPDRHRLVLSAGDAIDEHIVGGYWPEAADRTNSMFEAADVIRKLFAASPRGKDTRHSGASFRLESARLWTMPSVAPTMQVWAGGVTAARRAGRTADGIVVHAAPADKLLTLLNAFYEGQREAARVQPAGRRTVHVQLSWAETEEEAMAQVFRDWPMAGLRFPRGDIRSPFDVEQLTRLVTEEDVRRRVAVSADPEVHRRHLQSFIYLGFDAIHVHKLGRAQDAWIECFSGDILPRLTR